MVVRSAYSSDERNRETLCALRRALAARLRVWQFEEHAAEAPIYT